MNSSIKERAKFDIFELNPIENAEGIQQKCIFVKGEFDDLIKKKEFDKLVKVYTGEKAVFIIKESTHSEQRLPVTEPFKEAFLSLVKDSVILSEEEALKKGEQKTLNEKKLEQDNYMNHTISGSTNNQPFSLSNINSTFMKTFNPVEIRKQKLQGRNTSDKIHTTTFIVSRVK